MATDTFLSPHNLQTQHPDLIPLSFQETNWIGLVFLIALLLYSCFTYIYLYKNYSKFPDRVKSIFYLKPVAKSKYNRGYGMMDRYTSLLAFISVFCASLFVFQLYRELNSILADIFGSSICFKQISSAKLLLYSFLLTTILYISRCIYIYIYIMSSKGTKFNNSEFQLDLSYLFFWTLISFPLVFVSFQIQNVVAPFILTFLGICYVVITVYRCMKIYVMHRDSDKLSLLRIFLYICTLEVMPIACLFALVYMLKA